MGENFHKFSALCCCSAVIVAGTFILLWISIASISVSHAHSSLFFRVSILMIYVCIFFHVCFPFLLLLIWSRFHFCYSWCFFSVCRHSGSRYHVLLHFPSSKALNSALLSRASWSEILKRNCVIIKAFSGFLAHDTVEKGHKKLSSESQKSSSKFQVSPESASYQVFLIRRTGERTFSWNSESVQFPVRVGFAHFNSCPWHMSKKLKWLVQTNRSSILLLGKHRVCPRRKLSKLRQFRHPVSGFKFTLGVANDF